jgi:hypothetical protein
MLIDIATLVKSNSDGIKVWFSNITTKVWIEKFASKLHSHRNTYTRVLQEQEHIELSLKREYKSHRNTYTRVLQLNKKVQNSH